MSSEANACVVVHGHLYISPCPNLKCMPASPYGLLLAPPCVISQGKEVMGPEEMSSRDCLGIMKFCPFVAHQYILYKGKE